MPRATRRTPTPTLASPSSTSASTSANKEGSHSPARNSKGKQKQAILVPPLERRQSRRQSARQGSAKSSNPDNDEPASSSVPPSAAPSPAAVDEKPTLERDPEFPSTRAPSSKTSVPSKQNPLPSPVHDRSATAPEREDSPLTDLDSYPTSPAKPALVASQDVNSTTSKPQEATNEAMLERVATAVDQLARPDTSALEGNDAKNGNQDQSISPTSPVILPLLASASSTHSSPSSPPDLAAFVDKAAVPDPHVSTGNPPISVDPAQPNQHDGRQKEGIRSDLEVVGAREKGGESVEEPHAVALLETESDAGTVVENEHQEVTLESVDLDVTLDSVDADETFDESSTRSSSTPLLPLAPSPAPLVKLETKDTGFDATSLSTIEEDAPEGEEGPIASTSTLPAAPNAVAHAPTRSAPILTVDTSSPAPPLTPAINTPMALGMPVQEVRNRFNGYKIMAVLALNVELIRLALEWLLHRAHDGAGYTELTARLESNLHYLTAMAYQANQRQNLPPPPPPILEVPSGDIPRKRLMTSYTTLKEYFVASERFERQSQLRVAPISLLPPPASPRQRTVSPSTQFRTIAVAPSSSVEPMSTRSMRSQSPTKAESERTAAAYRRDSLSNDMAQEGGVAREQERLQALSDINIGVSTAPTSTSMPLRGPGKRDRSQSFPAEQHDDGSAPKRANYESAPSSATTQFAQSPRNGAHPFGYPPVDTTAATPSPFHPPSSPANQQLALQQQAFARQQQMATFTATQQQMMLAQQHLVTQRQAQATERQHQPSANVESPRLTNAVPFKRPGSALGHTSYSASSPPSLSAPSPSAQQIAPAPPHVDARPLTEQYSAIQAFINSPNFATQPPNVQQQLRGNAQQLLYRIRAEAAVAVRTSSVPVDRAASPMGIPAASPRHLPSPQLQQSQFRRTSINAGSTTSHAGSPSATGNAGGTPQAESSSSFFREQLAQQEIQLRSQSPAPPPQSPFGNYAQQPPNYPSPADTQSNRPQQTFSRQQTPAQAGSPANYSVAPQNQSNSQAPSPAFINPSPRMPTGTIGGPSPVISNGVPVPVRRTQDMAALQERDRLAEGRRVEQEAQIRAQDQLLARYQADKAREDQQQAMMRQQQQQQQQQAHYFQQEQYRIAQQNQMRMQQMQQQQQQRDPRYGYAAQGYAPQYQQPPPMIPNPFATQQPAFAPPPPPPSRPPTQQQQQQQYPPQDYPSEPVGEEPPAWDLFLNN